MDTPLLDAIRRNRGRLDELELCILWMGDEQDASEDDLETAELAAEKLAAYEHLAAVAHDVNEWLKTIDMGGTGHQRSLEAALAEYDKCRAT